MNGTSQFSMRQKSAFPWKNSNQILFGSFLLCDKRNEKLDALMFQPGAHMGSCSAREPHCVLSLASESESQIPDGCVRVRACVEGRVMAYTVRLHLKNQERYVPPNRVWF